MILVVILVVNRAEVNLRPEHSSQLDSNALDLDVDVFEVTVEHRCSKQSGSTIVGPVPVVIQLWVVACEVVGGPREAVRERRNGWISFGGATQSQPIPKEPWVRPETPHRQHLRGNRVTGD